MKTLLCFFMILTTVVAASTDARSPIIAAEQARRAALLTGDTVALAQVLSDDLLYVHSTGKREDKRAVLEGFSSKKVAYERFELGGLEARQITPDVAVLNGNIDQRKLGNGKWSDVKLLFQSVWRNEAGTWRMISMQTLQLPQGSPAPVTTSLPQP